VLAWFMIPETNPHILLQRRAAKLRKETGDDKWYAQKGVKETPTQLLLRSLVRPMKLLVFSPIVLSLALYLPSHMSNLTQIPWYYLRLRVFAVHDVSRDLWLGVSLVRGDYWTLVPGLGNWVLFGVDYCGGYER